MSDSPTVHILKAMRDSLHVAKACAQVEKEYAARYPEQAALLDAAGTVLMPHFTDAKPEVIAAHLREMFERLLADEPLEPLSDMEIMFFCAEGSKAIRNEALIDVGLFLSETRLNHDHGVLDDAERAAAEMLYTQLKAILRNPVRTRAAVQARLDAAAKPE